jgi:hypothetical protein
MGKHLTPQLKEIVNKLFVTHQLKVCKILKIYTPPTNLFFFVKICTNAQKTMNMGTLHYIFFVFVEGKKHQIKKIGEKFG